MVSGKKILWIVLIFCFLLFPVWNSALPVSAQDNSDDTVALLEQDAAKQGLSLGEYLWKMLHGKYNSLGDLAAKSLESFLDEGGTRTVSIDGKEMTVTVGNGAEGDERYEAYFDVRLRDDDGSESGVLILHMDSIRDYVNEKIYPELAEKLDETGTSTQFKQDLEKLLKILNIQPKAAGEAWELVVKELTENPEDYPAITAMLDKGSDEPLVTFIPDGGEDGAPVLTEIFTENDGSSEGDAAVFSASGFLQAANTLGFNPVPEAIAEKMEDKIEELVNADPEPDEPGNNGQQSGTRFLMDTVLPATGFSSRFVTELREQPLSLTYGMTGMILQIPELEVSEMILTVPNEADSYAVEWLDRNVGLLSESSLPGSGVTVLTGHNHLNTMETGPFLFIGELEDNDRIFIAGSDKELYAYKVYGNYKIAADDFAAVAGFVHENTLILITCEDESAEGGYLNRRVVFADPI